MLYMDITPEMLSSERSRLVLALLESWMYWPDDAPRRDGLRASARMEFLREAAEAIVNEQGPDAKFEITGRNILQLLLDLSVAPRISDVAQESRERFVQGQAVGRRILEVLRNKSIDPAESHFTKADQVVADWLRSNGITAVTKDTMRNAIWPTLRPVAHLWAAYIARVPKEGSIFPCRLVDVEDFLAEAEAYRRLGERLKSRPKSPGTIFDPTEMLRIPEAIKLPELAIRWLPAEAGQAN